MAVKKIAIAVAGESLNRPDVVDVLDCVHEVRRSLELYGYETAVFPVRKEYLLDTAVGVKYLHAANVDLIFNLFEGFEDDSSAEADFCDLIQKSKIVYTGNNAQVLALCRDKYSVNRTLERIGINVPESIAFDSAEETVRVEEGFPFFLKPRYEDGSLGIREDAVINTAAQLKSKVASLLSEFPSGVVIEEYLPGDEYTVGILSPLQKVVLGVSCMRYKSLGRKVSFMGYESKWDKNSIDYKKLTPQVCYDLSNGHPARAVATAFAVADVLKCDGYLRVDMRVKNGKLYVMDVNPNPALGSDCGLANQAKAAGIEYKQLIKRIVDDALLAHKITE